MRILRSFMTVGVVAATSILFLPTPAAAVSTFCPYLGPYHVAGHQYVTDNYYGQYGWLTTYDVSVPHWHDAFSVSHLYTYYGNTDATLADTVVEVGFYKGVGVTDYNVPHYYYV